MDKLLMQIGEFLAVDLCDVCKVKYFDNNQAGMKITTVSGKEILLNLILLN